MRVFWKPSTAGFERLLKVLNVKGQDCVYIADNEKKDFIAPNKLGFSTIQLIRPARIHTSAATEAGAAAHHVIHQFHLLPALLKTL